MTSSTLKSLQTQFLEALIDSRKKVPENLFHPQSNSQIGFGVYRYNRQFNLQKSLQDTYPTVQRIIGKLVFETVSQEYIHQNPLKTLNLNDYGKTFSNFLIDFDYKKKQNVKDDFSLDNFPFLEDIAHLDWMVHSVLIGQDNLVDFNWQNLQKIPASDHSNLKLNRENNSFLFDSLFPIDKIWECYQEENSTIHEGLSSVFEIENKTDISKQSKNYFIILRSGFDIRIDRLSYLEWEALQELNTKTLGEISESIVSVIPILIQKRYLVSYNITSNC